jgi:hypothetical protein
MICRFLKLGRVEEMLGSIPMTFIASKENADIARSEALSKVFESLFHY